MRSQTLKATRVGRNGTIELPSSVFHPSDRVAVFMEGNTVIVKKIAPSKLSEISSRGRKSTISIREIVKEIRRYRKEEVIRVVLDTDVLISGLLWTGAPAR